MNKISIVVLNWNNYQDTLECMNSLIEVNYENFNIVIVDNGSRNNSVSKIKKWLNVNKFKYIPKKSNSEFFYNTSLNIKIILIKNIKNYGFAKGNNIGIKFALHYLRANSVVLLNNDTIVHSDFLLHLINTSQEKKTIGIVGPKIYYYDNRKNKKEVIWSAGNKNNYFFPWLSSARGQGKFDVNQFKKGEVDSISGCCMLIKKEIFKSIGYFDPKYFCYGEEDDLCLRTTRGGFDIYYSPKSVIWHKVARSSGGGFNKTVAFYKIRNKIMFYKKNFPFYYFFTFFPYLFAFFIYKSFQSVINKKPEVIKSMINGFLWHFKNK